ncbi:MAG TPA: Ig-like domain-containing protein [Candidatus Dormibacteraeota bacterium]|nr:Ig-like domain-containing protein [Candidatus Dormibacteraeota bacterium]
MSRISRKLRGIRATRLGRAQPPSRSYRLLLRVVTGLVMAVLLCPALVEAATHTHPPPLKIYVNIALTVPATATTGDPFVISLGVSSSGVPVVKRLIRIYADGVEIAGIETNSAGDGSTTIRTALTAGSHTITAVFRGGGRIQSASASRTIVESAAPLSIRIVPYIPNSVSVTVNGGTPLVPNSEGFIVTNLTQGGKLTLDAILHNPAPGVRVTFVAWSNNDPSPVRTLDVRTKIYTQLAVQASYLTSLRFEDATGHRLSPAQLKGIQLSGPDGATLAPGTQSSVWLTTPVPRKTNTGALAVGADVYTVTSALFDGVNVADQGVDRFVPRPGGIWTVRLNVYPVTLYGKNLVLGGRAGVTVELTGPGTGKRRIALPARDQTTLLLPTGHYKVKLVGGGVGPALTMRVSRATSVPIPVLTMLDVIIGVVLGLGILALLIVFRPWRRLRRVRPAPIADLPPL